MFSSAQAFSKPPGEAAAGIGAVPGADDTESAVVQPGPWPRSEQEGKASGLDSPAQSPRKAVAPLADDPDSLVRPPSEGGVEVRLSLEQSIQSSRLDLLVDDGADHRRGVVQQQRRRRRGMPFEPTVESMVIRRGQRPGGVVLRPEVAAEQEYGATVGTETRPGVLCVRCGGCHRIHRPVGCGAAADPSPKHHTDRRKLSRGGSGSLKTGIRYARLGSASGSMSDAVVCRGHLPPRKTMR